MFKYGFAIILLTTMVLAGCVHAQDYTDTTPMPLGQWNQFLDKYYNPDYTNITDLQKKVTGIVTDLGNIGKGNKAEINIVNSSNVNLQVAGDSDRPVTIMDSKDVNGQIGAETSTSATMHNGDADAGLADMHNGNYNAISETGQQAYEPATQEHISANSTADTNPQNSGAANIVRGNIIRDSNGRKIGFSPDPNGSATATKTVDTTGAVAYLA